MREVEASVEQGGAYTATIEVARDRPALEPQTVGFRLTATAAEGRPARTIELASELTLRRLPDDYVRHGVVRDEFGTLFKSRYGDDRWGNLIAGSAFRIFERWGPRLSIHSVAGQAGFVESASVDLLPEGESPATLELTEPSLRLSGRAAMDRLTIEWSAERPPAALYLGPEVSRPSRLTVEFPSNVALRALSARFPSDDGAVSYIESVALRSGGSSTPPRAVFDLAGRELWGYGLTAPEPGRVELAVRARPDPPSAARDRPLGGLRVIVDAGHGGRDPGSIGPSGIAEADLNLVVSALLGRRLEALGAEVLQTRRDDAFVELDDRVRIAWAWDPDLFISVHHNSVDMATHPTKVRGPQVYYHYPHAIPTARKVAEELSALLAPGAPPDVRPQFFRVNRNVSPCPSILVEVAFICNPLDEAMLRDDAMLGLIAEAIARGVARVWTD
jgi:N-acetylmuramoyl-L-alanine amidase